MSILTAIINIIQWFFFSYFFLLHASYFVLIVVSLLSIYKYMQEVGDESLPTPYEGFEPPVSIIVPAFNESQTIIGTVEALLKISYTEFEIVVVNDGSTDDTLDSLMKKFSLIPFSEAYRVRMETRPIKQVFISSEHRNLRVVDKMNGGKADALNAGVNVARYPLVNITDADSVMQRDSLKRVVKPFLDNPNTIASGGVVRVLNGCSSTDGFLTRKGLPKSMLALFQIAEYLRAFLFGRVGWSKFNSVFIISGAFGLFRKESLIAANGFKIDTVGEDMELVLRLHKNNVSTGKKYSIVSLPDPICWTEVPEDFKTLAKQRIRWQIGLSQSIANNDELILNPRAGFLGVFGMPYLVIFEWLSPIIEVAGYLFTLVAYFLGLISLNVLTAFLVVAIGFGMLVSISALLVEEMSFRVYPRLYQVIVLFFFAIIENLGYRQMNSVLRLIGLCKWAFGKKSSWGSMKKKGKWHDRGVKAGLHPIVKKELQES